MNSFAFKAHTPRRLPDPVLLGCTRHVFLCAVQDMPQGLPKGANPRTQDDIDRGIYRDVKRSLLNEDCTPNTFHLKNKGITIIAEEVAKRDDDETLIVSFSSVDQGIVDGAHTYELIVRNQDAVSEVNTNSETPIRQFVKVEVLTGLSDGLVVEIAGGLNTAVQVQRMSLAELGDKFDWIKEELKGSGYESYIAFRQNEPKEYDVRDIIRLLDLFNVYEFPNDGATYPTRAYTSKETVLKHYLDEKGQFAEHYKRLRPILKDVLVLYDTVSAEARTLHNKAGGRGGGLKFVETSPKDKPFKFHFINEEREHRLVGGALLPMLGAFRAAVLRDPTDGTVTWNGGFERVLTLWREMGKELMQTTQETSEELGRNPNAIGKSKKHWAFLHNMVLRRISQQ
jgi:hypothetical protein